MQEDLKKVSPDNSLSQNREIKFIAYDTINNEFIEIENIRIARNNRPTSINDGQYQIQSNGQIILLQYTGLKDKNGVEIYEGDIVKYDGNSLYWEIKMIDGCWCFGRYSSSFLLYGYSMGYYVVGNIYQNPELLS